MPDNVKLKNFLDLKFSAFAGRSDSFQMANDLELFLVQISVNEAALRRVIDGDHPEFALLVTVQNHTQPAPERTGKNFSQISGPKFLVASHDDDTRRITDDPQVRTCIPGKVHVWRVASPTSFSGSVGSNHETARAALELTALGLRLIGISHHLPRL